MGPLSSAIQNRYGLETLSKCSLGCGQLIEELGLQPGEMVLDLGCGAGAEAIQAAKLVGPSGHATGLDLTADMLAQAMVTSANLGIENLSFVQGDIEMLPFPDGSFDVVQSNCVINHAADKARVFREIFRVLKLGGRLVFADAVSQAPLPESVKNDPAQWAACFGGAVTEQEYLHIIAETGFQQIKILNRREYLKNGYDFASLTIQALK